MLAVRLVMPYAEAIATSEVKLHARVDHDEEDDLILGYVKAAREKLENDCARALVAQTLRFDFDAFPDGGCALLLRYAPVLAVSSVKYYDTANVLTTWSAAKYDVDRYSIPGRVQPVSGGTYPSTYSRPRAVQVTAVVGHAVPFTVDATTDVLTWKGHAPTDGDLVRLTNTGGTLPAGLAADTDYYVISSSGATCELSLTSGGAAVDITGAGTGTHFVGEVPALALHAIRLLVGSWINNREAVLTGTISKEIEFAYTALTEQLMWSRYA